MKDAQEAVLNVYESKCERFALKKLKKKSSCLLFSPNTFHSAPSWL